MNSLKMIEKIKDKQGRIIACRAVDRSGNTYTIERKDFRKYNFINAVISKDLKIIPRKVSTNTSNPNYVILYHGSHTGIAGDIRADKSRESCDFGLGFYTGDNPDQAKTIIIDDKSGVFYTLGIQIDTVSTYRFANEIEWALYVGVHRGYIDVKNYAKLDKLVKHIDSHDIVIGPIADDRMSVVYPEFMEGNITDIALVNALKYVKYGDQYVFKNNTVCKNIKIIGSSSITKEEKARLKHIKNVTIGGLAETVEEIKKKFRRQGEYIDEILNNWR